MMKEVRTAGTTVTVRHTGSLSTRSWISYSRTPDSSSEDGAHLISNTPDSAAFLVCSVSDLGVPGAAGGLTSMR
jgi:hypothetical protein